MNTYYKAINLSATIILALISLSPILTSCRESRFEIPLDDNIAGYVSTLVGSQSDSNLSTGNTYPATAVPWGMNFWTPQTGKMGDGWAYTYDAKTICGFKQTHQPSPWINDYGQFSLMPVSDINNISEKDRRSIFSHKTEIAKPYYYKVYLGDPNVTAEMTTTSRAAILRFTFTKGEKGIVLDAFDHGSYISQLNDSTLAGYSTKNSGGVPENFKNYFVVKFSKPISSLKLYDGTKEITKASRLKKEVNHEIAITSFKLNKKEAINVYVASSFISEEQALQNLKEVEGKTFEQVKKESQNLWNKELGKIKVTGKSEDQYRTFYSCLYRSLLFPRSFYEINKEGKIVHYSPFNGEIREGYMFTDSGYWDTFRSLNPLLNLVYPSESDKMQEGLLNAYKESGYFPEWASPGHRDCMVGNNSASIVADAYIKGISDKEASKMFAGLIKDANTVNPKVSSTGRLGWQYYNKLGYVPCDVGINESAARTLEYAYNDWCIYLMGKKLGISSDTIDIYKQRSQNYKNLFDPNYNLMRGRKADGSFPEEFSPYKWGGDFTEGNSLQYTWSVFHDIPGLIQLMGGKENFISKLDSVFIMPPIYDDSYYGFRIHEISEMVIADMGNYAHGNQPAQHMTYLYDYVNQPYKTQYWVREVMNRLYTAAPDGYCGDEDNGQTSSWYVFSAMGFYPVNPVSGQYALGAPLFDHVQISLENGKKVNINSYQSGKDDRYIKSKKLNNSLYEDNFITYKDLKAGLTLDLEMNNTPTK